MCECMPNPVSRSQRSSIHLVHLKCQTQALSHYRSPSQTQALCHCRSPSQTHALCHFAAASPQRLQGERDGSIMSAQEESEQEVNIFDTQRQQVRQGNSCGYATHITLSVHIHTAGSHTPVPALAAIVLSTCSGASRPFLLNTPQRRAVSSPDVCRYVGWCVAGALVSDTSTK